MTPLHLLLVEDDEPFARILEGKLARTAKLRCAVTRVTSRNAMEQVLALRSVDLILLDLTLPDSHGVDTVAAAVRHAPNTPVVVLSGREDLDVAIVAMRAGAQDYLVKRAAMDVDELERALLYALLRAQQASHAKRLMLATTRAAHERPTPPPAAGTVEPHIEAIEAIVNEIRAHLRRNNTTQAEAVDAILARHEWASVIRELRSLLQLSRGRARAFSSPDLALAEIIGEEPETTAAAEAELIAYLEGLDG